MNAPSSPRPTWSVALWCEWYMCEPAVLADELVGEQSPGWIGSWVMCGTPSIAFGRRCPWKWIPVDSSRLFLKIARTLSPSTTSIRGPGHVPLNPSASSGALLRVDLVLDRVDRQLEDLGVAVELGRERLVAGPLHRARSRRRGTASTTASAGGIVVHGRRFRARRG